MKPIVIALALVACSRSSDPTTNGSSGSAAVEPTKPVPVAPAPPVLPAPPFDVPPPSDKVVGIGRDRAIACVVRASGGVDCWGADPPRAAFSIERSRYETQLVKPDPRVRRAPGVADAIAISSDASCVLRKTGGVACMDADKLAFTTIPGLANVTELPSAGRCFIVGTGNVWCVDEGKLIVTAIHDALSIVASVTTTCAVRKIGKVACTHHHSMPWAIVKGLDRVETFVMPNVYDNDLKACAVRAGKLGCFFLQGVADDAPTFAVGPVAFSDIPAGIAGATNLAMDHDSIEGIVGGKIVTVLDGVATPVASITDATDHVLGCAIRGNGAVACWGSNAGGVLGQPSTIGTLGNPATPVVGLSDIVDLVAANDDTYAVTSKGLVYAGATLVKTEGPTDIVHVFVSNWSTLCVRTRANEDWCSNGLGASAWEKATKPVDISEGNETTCTVDAKGRVTCVEEYQDGDDNGLRKKRSFTPIERDAARAFAGTGRMDNEHGRQMAGGRGCAIMRDRTVQCWGSNMRGELGDGLIIDSAAPVGIKL